MPIRINEQEKSFCIETENTMYQMKADEYGVLKHIWYGEHTGCDMEYLLDYPDVGFSGNIYDAGNKRNYSLDTMPLEYSASGIGDFRLSAISAVHSDGSNALDLRYQGYFTKKGKYSIMGLPCVYADEDTAETLEILLKDITSNITVILKYGVLDKLDIITRSAVIMNSWKYPVTLKKAFSICLDFPQGNLEWVHFHGRHAMERIVERAPLIHGIAESSSERGASSHQQNPSVLLCDKNCTEENGSCFGAVLIYSGSFQTKIECDQLDQVRMVMGINPKSFSWILKEGEKFYTPEVILSYSGKGMQVLSHNFHRVIRNNVCRGKYKLAERSVLINNWEATYYDFDDKKLLSIAKDAARLGVDMLVIDDGWFGKRNDDRSGLGDWFVNENKIKEGLCSLVEKVRSLGLKCGIWFEPEMVSEDSILYREHPDWAIKIPNRKPMRSRFQLVLDLTRQDVRDYIYNSVSRILKCADISYVKWDMNRSICDWYSAELSPERQGEMPHRYILGLYELLEKLTSDFPDVLFEGCSGGGGRFDAGMLYYCPQIWCSDNTDAYERTKIQYGTSFFYPISSMGTHVSAVPNHQTGRTIPLESRAVVAMAGSFGYELDPSTLSQQETLDVRNQIRRYKKYRTLIHNGFYYRLSNPIDDNYAVWSFVSSDRTQVLVQGMIFHTKANVLRTPIKLRGLSPDKKYILESSGQVYTGKALMEGGILLPRSWGDYYPVEMYFTAFL